MFGIDDALMAAAIPSVIGLGGSLMGNLFNQSNAKSATESSREGAREAAAFNEQQYSQRYQTTAKDMRAAGINPIMAATGGFSVGPSPTMQNPQAFQPAPVESFSSSAKQFGDLANTMVQREKGAAETLNVIKDTQKKVAEIDKIVQDKIQSQAQTENIKMSTQESWTRIVTMEMNFATIATNLTKMNQEIAQIMTQTSLTAEQRQMTAELTQKIKAEKAKLNSEYKILETELTKLRARNEIYKNEAGELLGIVSEVFKSVSPFAK